MSLADTDDPTLAAADAKRHMAEDRVDELGALNALLQSEIDRLRGAVAAVRDDPDMYDERYIHALDQILKSRPRTKGKTTTP